jgi:hypothetical protein
VWCRDIILKMQTWLFLLCWFPRPWISPIEYARQYVQNRKVSAEKPDMSKHYHIESRLSHRFECR